MLRYLAIALLVVTLLLARLLARLLAFHLLSASRVRIKAQVIRGILPFHQTYRYGIAGRPVEHEAPAAFPLRIAPSIPSLHRRREGIGTGAIFKCGEDFGGAFYPYNRQSVCPDQAQMLNEPADLAFELSGKARSDFVTVRRQSGDNQVACRMSAHELGPGEWRWKHVCYPTNRFPTAVSIRLAAALLSKKARWVVQPE